ncbi:hypothetical protein DRN46_02245 [Thermococci archaeon]|nr:MAG: hypothetical protein DRN46_02245 [Thermococci archaeon]RLF94777.1 MAG: hypothetical protein DRN52_04710 [Thermococci archaeon]
MSDPLLSEIRDLLFEINSRLEEVIDLLESLNERDWARVHRLVNIEEKLDEVLRLLGRGEVVD